MTNTEFLDENVKLLRTGKIESFRMDLCLSELSVFRVAPNVIGFNFPNSFHFFTPGKTCFLFDILSIADNLKFVKWQNLIILN